MKTIAVIAVVCYLFVATVSFPTISPELNKCSAEQGIATDRARELATHRGEPASNDNEKCFLGCYLKERGYLVNGKMNFTKLLENHVKYQPDKYDELKQAFDECEKNMNYNGKNDCEVAFDAYSCAFNKA